MPRSHYIYLVRYNACGTVLGAFTVKREAVEWATRESGHPLEHLQLSSIKDGVWADKTESTFLEMVPFRLVSPAKSYEEEAARLLAVGPEPLVPKT